MVTVAIAPLGQTPPAASKATSSSALSATPALKVLKKRNHP
jgi:hypothetical protein